MNTLYVLFGLGFGFILSRVGATDYDTITRMLRLEDVHLFGVLGLAIAISAAGFHAFRSGRIKTASGAPAALSAKPMVRGLFVGGMLFGVGWAVSGTCPGTALAQIGEGHWAGFFTFAGILGGAGLYQWTHQRRVA